MEKTKLTINKTKVKQKSEFTALRVRKNTLKKLQKHLSLINKKEYGKKIRPDFFLNFLLDTFDPADIEQIQESSLSELDKFERDFKMYCKNEKVVTKEEFFRLVRQGKVFGIQNSQSLLEKKDISA